MIKNILLLMIKLYQRTLSPDHSWVKHFRHTGACKFRPTCSEYTYSAVEKYGSLKGIFLGIKRILRCHPWSKGGWDPLK